MTRILDLHFGTQLEIEQPSEKLFFFWSSFAFVTGIPLEECLPVLYECEE